MFFDIDGTILTLDTHEVPNSTIKAIKEARSKGHLTFINTGRTYFNIDKEIREIGFDGYVCGCGTYVNAEGTVITNVTIAENECHRIIDILRKHKIDAVLEGLNDVYFDSYLYTEDMKKIQSNFNVMGYGIEKNWDSKDFVFDKLFAKASDEANIEEFIRDLGAQYDYIDRGNRFGEIMPKGYSKASGIKRLLDHYGISIEDAYVFGDSSNDLAMFEYIPNSVAMGESDECIYNKASFITKDIKNDGIYHAMKHFSII
ncbi:MAG: HAD-superfamily hydrolase, subfamily [Anaerocolumna sp.]|nr:HAD-superfamily hydrolase, subfamily [Anaerocolumna sp.]